MAEQQSSLSPEQPVSSVWPDWQKQIIAILLLVAIPVAIYFLRPVIPALLLTFAFTFILMYPVRWLQKLKLSYRGSALIVYFIFLIISMVAIIWFMVYAVTSFFDTLQGARGFIEQIFAGVTGKTDDSLSEMLSLNFLMDGMKALSVAGAGLTLLTSPGDFFAAVFEKLSHFTSFVSNYAFMIVLLLFFLMEWPRTLGILNNAIPTASRREYSILINRMINIGKSYLLGSLVIVLFYWVVTAILFWVSGIPYPIALALIVAIPNFIPQGGGLVSAILVFVISLVTGSAHFAMNNLIFAFIEMTIFMLISGVAYYFVDVRIYSKSVNVPVWIILVGIMVFGAFAGVIGVFFAAAVVAILGEVLGFTLKKLRGEDPYPDVAEPPLFADVIQEESTETVEAANG